MSDSAPSCSCRLPWIVAVFALGIAVAAYVAGTPAPQPPTAHEVPPIVAIPPTADPQVATLQHDLSEARRVLDDAQSALGQRDREIATANDELRTLRQELETLRAKATPAP